MKNRPAGNIIAENVSAEDYLAQYAANFCEWVEGYVIKLPPPDAKHALVTRYLHDFFEIYLPLRPVARARQQPFVMVMLENTIREPDFQIVFRHNLIRLNDPEQRVKEAADICIEVLMPESEISDRGEKFVEYEAAGVREYWLIDPLREEALFYGLNDAGYYRLQYPDSDGFYRARLLPDFALHIPTLWLDEADMPDTVQIRQMLEKMLKS